MKAVDCARGGHSASLRLFFAKIEVIKCFYGLNFVSALSEMRMELIPFRDLSGVRRPAQSQVLPAEIAFLVSFNFAGGQ
jgi:hypothetical protein